LKQSIDLLIRNINIHLQRVITHIIVNNKAHGGTQGKILGYLNCCDNQKTYQKDLEVYFGVRRSTMSKMLSCLEKTGYIYSLCEEKDKRVKTIYLTDLGKKECETMDKTIKSFYKDLTYNLSKEQLNDFINTSNILETNLINIERKQKNAQNKNTSKKHSRI